MTDFNRDYKALHTVSAWLTNFALIYKNATFIADDLAPEIPVERASDKYPIYDKERFRWENTARRDKGQIGVSTEGFSSATYSTQGYALGDWLSKKEMMNADAVLKGQIRTTNYLTEKIKLDREVRVHALATADASFATGHTKDLVGGEGWNEDTGDPILNIEEGIAQIKSATFKTPDRLTLPWNAALKFARHPKVVAFNKKTDNELVTALGLPTQIMGLKVVISEAGYSVVKKGQTHSISNILGNYAIISYSGSPEYGDPSWLQSFKWLDWEVESTYDGQRKAEFVSVEAPEWDEKLISNVLAYRISGIIQ